MEELAAQCTCLLSWNVKNCLVDLEKELAVISEQALEGEEARYGERLIQYASENLVTEILIHPVVSTLVQCMRNLLSSFTRHRHIIHAGYTFASNGSWALQDGTFSYADFSEAFQEIETQRVIHAYENGISVDIHCTAEGDWCRLPKESFAKGCNIRINPNDVLTYGSPAITEYIKYISQFITPTTLESLLECSDVVGNIRFSRPTLYVFPGGQGDAALFGVNGFNMLLDGGFSRKACFWDFVRHLDRLDAVLMTRLNNSNIGGISSILRRKRKDAVYPHIGHFFCNLQDRKITLSPDEDKDRDPLLIDLLIEGQEIISNLSHLNLNPQMCYRDQEPINLYHKVGHGTLNMYVLNPSKDSKEVKDFLQKWNQYDQKLFSKQQKEFNFPIQNLISIAVLIIWQPANINDTITRILYPGSAPQQKIFEGLDKIKDIEFTKYSVCSEKSLYSKFVIRKTTKNVMVEKSLSKEKQIEKKDKITDNNFSSEIKMKRSDVTENDRSRNKKTEENKGSTENDKLKIKSQKNRIKYDSQQRKKSIEKKDSPTTPKKSIEPEESRKSVSSTPAKSTKDANNRKVIENKVKLLKSVESKTNFEKKNTSKRPKALIKTPKSPAKKVINGIQKIDNISRKVKIEKNGTTDSSTVSTPTADQDSLKKDISNLTSEEIQQLKAQELADLEEEQEAVKEIEAVFRKSEIPSLVGENIRKVKTISIDEDKNEKDEYLIIEKEDIGSDLLDDDVAKESEFQKLTRDSEESEKQIYIKQRLQPEESMMVKNAVETVESGEISKDVVIVSQEDKPEISNDRRSDREVEVKDVFESHPDEKMSANIKSGDTTTAPTLPEDERIPLDDIKEDNRCPIEEKYAREETKEKGVPIIQLPPKTFDTVSKSPAVGIRLDKQSHIRDIVKTPDEVADLPVHEEVDYEYSHETKTELKINDNGQNNITNESEEPDLIKENKEESHLAPEIHQQSESRTNKDNSLVCRESEEPTTSILFKDLCQTNEIYENKEFSENMPRCRKINNNNTVDSTQHYLVKEISEKADKEIMETKQYREEDEGQLDEAVFKENIKCKENLNKGRGVEHRLKHVSETDDKANATHITEKSNKDKETDEIKLEKSVPKDNFTENKHDLQEHTDRDINTITMIENITNVEDKIDIIKKINDETSLSSMKPNDSSTETNKQQENLGGMINELNLEETPTYIKQNEDALEYDVELLAITVEDNKITLINETEPITEKSLAKPNNFVVFDNKSKELIGNLEMEKQLPKDREEDVIKIVATVAEVLKSDAPLEEFDGKLPISFDSCKTTYVTELRETHITTVEPRNENNDNESNILPIYGETPKESNVIDEKDSYEYEGNKTIKNDPIKDIKRDGSEEQATVQRMLITTSSEDGGEEIEICPVGTITFSKSSESSGKSSPEKSQESKRSSMVDTISDAINTVKFHLNNEIEHIHNLKTSEKKDNEIGSSTLENISLESKLYNKSEDSLDDNQLTEVKDVENSITSREGDMYHSVCKSEEERKLDEEENEEKLVIAEKLINNEMEISSEKDLWSIGSCLEFKNGSKNVLEANITPEISDLEIIKQNNVNKPPDNTEILSMEDILPNKNITLLQLDEKTNNFLKTSVATTAATDESVVKFKFGTEDFEKSVLYETKPVDKTSTEISNIYVEESYDSNTKCFSAQKNEGKYLQNEEDLLKRINYDVHSQLIDVSETLNNKPKECPLAHTKEQNIDNKLNISEKAKLEYLESYSKTEKITDISTQMDSQNKFQGDDKNEVQNIDEKSELLEKLKSESLQSPLKTNDPPEDESKKHLEDTDSEMKTKFSMENVTKNYKLEDISSADDKSDLPQNIHFECIQSQLKTDISYTEESKILQADNDSEKDAHVSIVKVTEIQNNKVELVESEQKKLYDKLNSPEITNVECEKSQLKINIFHGDESQTHQQDNRSAMNTDVSTDNLNGTHNNKLLLEEKIKLDCLQPRLETNMSYTNEPKTHQGYNTSEMVANVSIENIILTQNNKLDDIDDRSRMEGAQSNLETKEKSDETESNKHKSESENKIEAFTNSEEKLKGENLQSHLETNGKANDTESKKHESDTESKIEATTTYEEEIKRECLQSHLEIHEKSYEPESKKHDDYTESKIEAITNADETESKKHVSDTKSKIEAITPPTVPTSPATPQIYNINLKNDIKKQYGLTLEDEYFNSSDSNIFQNECSIKDEKITATDSGIMNESFYGNSAHIRLEKSQITPSCLYEITKANYIYPSPSYIGNIINYGNTEEKEIKASENNNTSDIQVNLVDGGDQQKMQVVSNMAEHSGGRDSMCSQTEYCRTYLYEKTIAEYNNKGQHFNKTEKDSDTITMWGKPLGLPSPAPANDNNKGTPKKERKLPFNVTVKNKWNDDKKRPESPSKSKNRKMSPIYVDLTYVPHHGNSYYSYIDFFKTIRSRYYVFSGIEPGREVYNALLEAKQTWDDKELEVTIIPTYDTDVLGYWVAENEELLTKCKIDLSPSASRCTINLQDHETSCSAYRLEF